MYQLQVKVMNTLNASKKDYIDIEWVSKTASPSWCNFEPFVLDECKTNTAGLISSECTEKQKKVEIETGK